MARPILRLFAIGICCLQPGCGSDPAPSEPIDVAVTRSWPAGCPVRVQLYRLIDSLLVYDETKLPCALPGLTTLTIRPRDRVTLGSGSRAMPAVAGDSIAYGVYRVVAVPQTEGTRVIRLEAGLLNLRAVP